MCLVLLITAGCASENEYQTKTMTHGDLTITVPGHYYDYLNFGDYEGVDFAYGFGELNVNGYHTTSQEMDGWTPTATEYAQAFVAAFAPESSVEILDDIVTVYYEVQEDTTVTGWLTAFFQCSDGIWIVECSCPADSYRELEQSMLNILTTIEVH